MINNLSAIDEEHCVILCMMESKECLEKANAELQFEDFSKMVHQEMFKLLLDIYILGGRTDVIGLPIENKSEIERITGSWVAYCNSKFVMPSNIDIYIKKLKEATKKRKLYALSELIKIELEKDELSTDELAEKVEIALIEREKTIEREYLSPEAMFDKCQSVILERMDEATRERKVINTGFSKLNSQSGGFEAGDLIILSGETGGGKSAFAANLAKDIAVIQKQPLIYINSEMSAEQMALRWASLLGGVKHTDLRNGAISESCYTEILSDLEKLKKSHLHTATIPDLKISSVLSEIRRAKRRYNARVAIVDYIGRVDMENANKDDWQVMTGAARKLKTIAQQEQLVVIMIAQLNAGGRLAQASYMTHEADLWLNLRKPTEKELQGEQLPWWNMFLEIKKARNASVGKMKMNFKGERMRFYDGQYENAL